MKNVNYLFGLIILIVVLALSGCSNGTTDGNTEIIPPGYTLSSKLSWLNTMVKSNTAYLVEVNDSETIDPDWFSYNGKTGVKVRLKGLSGPHTISLSGKGQYFNVSERNTLILDGDIILKGRADNDNPLISVFEKGKLIMNSNSEITGNTNSGTNGCGGGVFVDGGTLIMNGTAAITKNTAIYEGGGVHVYKGTFTMNDFSEISGNESKTNGGGVEIEYSTFTMSKNAAISGNKATLSGGAVYIDKNSDFIMKGGVIYGKDESSGLANTAGGDGASIYVNDGTARYSKQNILSDEPYSDDTLIGK